MATIKVKDVAELRSAVKTGGTIQLPDDYLEISSQVVITKPCVFKGADDFGSIFTIPDNCKLPADVALMTASYIDGIEYRGVAYDGNDSGQNVPRGKGYFNLAELKHCDDLVFDKNYLHNAMCDGFRVRWANNVQYTGNKASELGHDAIYCIGDCNNVTISGNYAHCRTNSGARIGYGGSNIKIFNNTFESEHKGGHTGPAVQFDKNNLKNVEIFNNKFTDIYGSGIWMPGTGGSASNVKIHHNTFKNVGKLPGYLYSQAAITIGGWDGIEIYNNLIEDVWNAIRYFDRNGVSSTGFSIISKNNTIRKVKDVVYDVQTSGGKIVVTNDSVSSYGELYEGNVKITEGTPSGTAGAGTATTPTETEESEDATVSPEEENILITLELLLPDGSKGKETFTLQGTKVNESAGSTTLVTCKFIAPDGSSADKTFNMPVSADRPESGDISAVPDGTNLVAIVQIMRENNDYGKATVLLTTTDIGDGKAGVASTVFKVKTPDGWYASRSWDMELSGSSDTGTTPVETGNTEEEEEPDTTGGSTTPETNNETPVTTADVEISVTLPSGETGKESFSLTLPTKQSATGKVTTLVTCQVTTPTGATGKSTKNIHTEPIATTMAITNTDTVPAGNVRIAYLIKYPDGTGGEMAYMQPVTGTAGDKATGAVRTIFKLKTPVGYYGEKTLDIPVTGTSTGSGTETEPTTPGSTETGNTNTGGSTPNTATSENCRVTVTIKRKDGKIGTTTFSLPLNPDPGTTTGTEKVTCKFVTPDGYSGDQTFDLFAKYTADSFKPTKVKPVKRKDDTGETVNVTVKVRRQNGDYGQATYDTPTSKVAATGVKATRVEFKLRTENKLYGEKKFDMLVK